MKYAVNPSRTVFFQGTKYPANTVLSEKTLKAMGEEMVANFVADEMLVSVEGVFVPEPEPEREGTWSVWTLDPATLQKTSLEALNMKVKELDPKVKPFETREEAIAQLSADWKA